MDFPFKSWEEIPVGIYAIAHNEAKFVPRWLESMKEADKIYVYENNNSSDGTYELLCEYAEKEEYKGKLIVSRGEVKPFRFDTARNQGMEQIPVWGKPDSVYALWCTDIDETLTPGWADAFRKKIFEVGGNFYNISYLYAWNHDENGNPGRVFWYDKTILNDGYWHWAGPVHEWQERKENAPKLGPTVQIDNGETIWLHHYPDNTKSRGSYLGLLELRTKETPDDLNGRCYLVREYRFHNQWENSVKEGVYTYMKAVSSGNGRMDILTFLAKEVAMAFSASKCPVEAEFFFKRAIELEPRLKDNYMAYAQFLAYQGRGLGALEQIRLSKEKSVHLQDWRELDYMWSEWKESQIKADAYAWLGEYQLAWLEINRGLHSMKSKKDRYEARCEGFFSDYAFIKEKYDALYPPENEEAPDE